MPSNLELILGAAQQAPQAYQQYKQMDAQFGKASPEEIHASEILKRVAAGEDPVAVARDVHQKYTAGGLASAKPAGTNGAPVPAAPASAVPSAGLAAPATASAPAQSQASVTGAVTAPAPAARPGLGSPETVTQEKSEPAGMADESGEQHLPGSTNSPWKPNRDELARVNETYKAAGMLKAKQREDKFSLEQWKSELRRVEDEANNKAKADLEGHKAEWSKEKVKLSSDAALKRLDRTLSSQEKRAMLYNTVRSWGIEVKDTEFNNMLDYLKANSMSKEQLGHAIIASRGNPKMQLLGKVMDAISSNPAIVANHPEMDTFATDVIQAIDPEAIIKGASDSTSKVESNTQTQTSPQTQMPEAKPAPANPLKPQVNEMIRGAETGTRQGGDPFARKPAAATTKPGKQPKNQAAKDFFKKHGTGR